MGRDRFRPRSEARRDEARAEPHAQPRALTRPDGVGRDGGGASHVHALF